MDLDLLVLVLPAFVAGIMIAATHAPLGLEVLKRGIVFMDLAVAQIAGLGMVGVLTWVHHPSAWLIQGVALYAALLSAAVFRWIESMVPERQEAIIGTSFVVAASAAILVLQHHPHGGETLQHMVSGQLLFVTWLDVLKHAPIYIGIVLAWFLHPRWRSGLGFYSLFALAITSSVQLVGVYVVFASLILPALVATGRSCALRTAWSFGGLMMVVGCGSALFLDVPAGPMVVIVGSLLAVGYWVWGSRCP